MIAGILDAMRTSYTPATRIVWQCIENHANSARFWSMTDRAIADEVHFSVDTVSRSLGTLERDGILRCVRRKRRPTTFYVLRSYPSGCPRPPKARQRSMALELPPLDAGDGAELTPQPADSNPKLSPQNPETLNPPVQNPTEEGREGARLFADEVERHLEQSDPTPAQVADKGEPRPEQPDRASAQLPPQKRERPRIAPPPADWKPSSDDCAYARSLGLDPAEMAVDMVAYYRAAGECPWPTYSAAYRAWCRREQKFYPRPPNRIVGQRRPSQAERDAAHVDHVRRRVAAWVETHGSTVQ
jgi:hypothetical protein